MPVFKNSLVDIPDDKGVHVKSAGVKGEKYVYKYVKYFRNSDGNPRNKAKAIGKFDPTSGKMWPNHNYFEIYHIDPVLPDISVWDYGYSYLVLKACRDTGLLNDLTGAFGERAMDIIVMAAYMIREGNAMDGFDDWQEKNYFTGFERLLTSQSISRIFASLSATNQEDFFKSWVKRTLNGGSVCYDVTSISSYSREMTAVERGYNRDGDDLAQYNLGMFCDESTRVPVYYNRYNGSLTDKTNLSYVLANAKEMGIEKVNMVLDGGFWSKTCLVNLKNFCETFTIGMPIKLTESAAILAGNGGDIEKYTNKLTTHNIYCIPVATEIQGVAGRVLLYFDSQSRVSQCAEMSEYIDRLKSELSRLKRYPKSKLKRFSPYFIIIKHDNDSGFDYVPNTVNIEKLRKTKGYFLIFSTDMASTPSVILDHYRAKDADEKLFAQIKVDMDGGRIRTHNEATTDGKTFVTFIACAIRAYLLKKLTQYLADNSTSLKKVFNQLSNITILSGHEGYRFTKALTKKQKQILTAFDAAHDIVKTLKENTSTLKS
jgi:transposase